VRLKRAGRAEHEISLTSTSPGWPMAAKDAKRALASGPAGVLRLF
jgi:hypothetical protein